MSADALNARIAGLVDEIDDVFADVESALLPPEVRRHVVRTLNDARRSLTIAMGELDTTSR